MADPPLITLRAAPRGADAPATAARLLAWLGRPTLLVLEGRDGARTRGVVTLLHGNEPSGLRALVEVLRSDVVPATRVVCLVAAVEAALAEPGFAARMLPGRRDLNRCFTPPWDGPDGALAADALRLLREAGCEALVDLHNNTGHNPAYGVATSLDAARVNLTAFFAERLVVSNIRLGTLCEATADDFPSVTIECGRAGDEAADAAAYAGLVRYLTEPGLETRTVRAPRMSVLDEPVRVSVVAGLRLAFAGRPDASADLTLAPDLDRHNFEVVLPGAPLGWLRRDAPWPLDARGADGEEVSRDLFVVRDGRVETRRALVPIMMTTDAAAVLADCLFYAVRPREEIRGG